MTHPKKIFYGAAIQGAQDRSERTHIHRQTIETIKSFGFTVVSEHATGENLENTAQKLEDAIGPLPPTGIDRTTFIRNEMIQFLESDIAAAVFEVSTPSLGTGIEIAHAYLRPRLGLTQIPVIALYQKGFWPNHLSAMIRGITRESVPYFRLIEYPAPEKIPTLIEPLLTGLNKSTPNASETSDGCIVARKCSYCGHHEIGIQKKDGDYIALKPGMAIKLI